MFFKLFIFNLLCNLCVFNNFIYWLKFCVIFWILFCNLFVKILRFFMILNVLLLNICFGLNVCLWLSYFNVINWVILFGDL